MSTLLGLAGVSQIESIQRGSTSITAGNATATATLSPGVDTTKAVVLFGGQTVSASDLRMIANVVLSNTTTLTFSRTLTTGTTRIAWQVIEFK